MTPKELGVVFVAAAWRQEQERERDTTLAWQIAGLSRARRLPSLKQLLHPPETKKLAPEEAAKRRAEFEELTKRLGNARRRTGKSNSRH